MKNTYSQLSSEEKDQIAILRAQGKSLSDIAKIIGRNKSTFPENSTVIELQPTTFIL